MKTDLPACLDLERAALVEEARQQGPDHFCLHRLHELTDVARKAGLERDHVSMMLMVHAITLCRPDGAARWALARFLVREARKLDTDAVNQAVEESAW